MKKRKREITLLAVFLLVVCLAIFYLPQLKSEAATLSTARIYLSRVQQNVTSGVTQEIQFTPASNVTGGTGNNSVIVIFPLADGADWCRTAGSLSVSTTSLKDSATALPGTSKTAACTQGNDASTYDTITISGVDDLTAGTTYAVIVSDSAGALGTPAATTTGLATVKTNNGSTDVDTRTVALDIITADQITVSGTVDPTLTFSIPSADYAIGFGVISSSALRYATENESGDTSPQANDHPIKLSVSTNADDGAIIEVKDVNNGMYSADTGTTITAVASSDVTGGVAEYGIYGKNSSGITIDEGFNNDTVSDVAVASTYKALAATTAPVSGGTLDVQPLASVSATTPAGSYTDTLTFVATGKF